MVLKHIHHMKAEKFILYNNENSSYEFTSGQHGDEEYAYLIDCDDHTLKCYSIGCDEFEWNENNIEYIPGQRDDGKVD